MNPSALGQEISEENIDVLKYSQNFFLIPAKTHLFRGVARGNLSDQSTLFKPRGQIMPLTLLPAPPPRIQKAIYTSVNAYKPMYFDRNISEKDYYLSCITNGVNSILLPTLELISTNCEFQYCD